MFKIIPLIGRGKILIISIFLFCFSNTTYGQFTKVSGAKGLDDNTGGNINGHAWGDVDEDGDLDVIFFTAGSGSNAQSKLFINSGAPLFIFTDQTSTRIAGFNDFNNYGRQMLIADFNNDGYNDILRGFGSSRETEIFYNDGPPNYTFGLPTTQQPDVTIGAPLDGRSWNTEGICAVDWNQDGWLDLIIDNDDGGNDVWENDQSGGFTYVSPGTGVGETGFPSHHSGDGDFMTAADIDNDGYIDLYGRKTAVTNYWHFNPISSQFETQAIPNIVSNESDKGGTMFCDFDNDGDLDLFWTSYGTNQIWRNDGSNIWTATGIPGTPIDSETNIDGCDCGDYDNDGDNDILLGNNSGNSFLLENTTPEGGALSFSTINIAVNANTESVSFVDYNNDGDLDLFFLVNGGENQLWENSTDDKSFLIVNARKDLGGGLSRDAIGANIFLINCYGDTTTMRTVSGGKGHGSQHQPKIHFGVNRDISYNVQVHYPFENGVRRVITKSLVPSNEPNQEVIILDTDISDPFFCSDVDNDGVLNYYDLDADNDGILDTEENNCPDNNLAELPSGTADASSLYLSLPASLANDGNTSGIWGDGSVAHTNGSSGNDWIDVDLGGINEINNVVVWNRTDACCSERLSDCYVMVSTTQFPNSTDLAASLANSEFTYQIGNSSGVASFDINIQRLARYVRVQKSGTNSGGNSLQIAELQVFEACDYDGDGIVNFLDSDSDNDGCPDAVEAGHTDANNDGYLDGTGYDSDGLVTGATTSYTGTTSEVTDINDDSACCDVSQSGFADFDGDNYADSICDLDDDNDGITDINEYSCAVGLTTSATFNSVTEAWQSTGATMTAGTIYSLSPNGSSLGTNVVTGGPNVGQTISVVQFASDRYSDLDGYGYYYSDNSLESLHRSPSTISFANLTGTEYDYLLTFVGLIDANGNGQYDVGVDQIIPALFSENGTIKFAAKLTGTFYVVYTDTNYSDNSGTFSFTVQECIPTDTDGDGDFDHADNDSDNDGCFDVREVRHIDADNDGMMDGSGIDINGMIIGATTSYTGNDVSVTDSLINNCVCPSIFTNKHISKKIFGK